MPRSSRNAREQGFRNSYEARTGVGGFPPLRGMDKESDPGAIPDNEFAEVVNMRINLDGILQSRGGQGKVYDVALTGKIEGIFEAGVDGEPVPIGGPPPPPYKPPPIPPGGIVDLVLSPTQGGTYTGFVSGTPQGKAYAVADNDHNTNMHQLTSDAPGGNFQTFLFHEIPLSVPGSTPLILLVLSIDPLLTTGTLVDGQWQSTARCQFRTRLGGVNVDSGFFTPVTDGVVIEWAPPRPGGGSWTVADLQGAGRAEFGLTYDNWSAGSGADTKPQCAKMWLNASYNG